MERPIRIVERPNKIVERPIRTVDTPPPRIQKNIQNPNFQELLSSNLIRYGSLVCPRSSNRLQLRVVQKNSIVHFWMQHGCSSLKVRPRHGWVRWSPSSSIYMKSTNQHILNVRALGQKAFVFLYHAFLYIIFPI